MLGYDTALELDVTSKTKELNDKLTELKAKSLEKELENKEEVKVLKCKIGTHVLPRFCLGNGALRSWRAQKFSILGFFSRLPKIFGRKYNGFGGKNG